ncbi:hypothetical protein OH77DRAFT_631143 [Trametes cingulata]|nr:hypothetical protein OH77DRAFT_631143 [Trametes cingulata]
MRSANRLLVMLSHSHSACCEDSGLSWPGCSGDWARKGDASLQRTEKERGASGVAPRVSRQAGSSNQSFS